MWTISEICSLCSTLDDENHRLNICPKWEDRNFSKRDTKVNFIDIYSEDIDTVRKIIVHNEKIWNTRTAGGSMNDALSIMQ